MTEFELTIRGDIQRLHLEPGDKILVTVKGDTNPTPDEMQRLYAEFRQMFPDHTVIIVNNLGVEVVSEVPA